MRRMFYNYYFSLSFLCLAHFLLLCSALLVHLPRLSPLSLSLSLSRFRIYLFGVFFAPRFTLHLTFGLALNERKICRFFLFIYLSLLSACASFSCSSFSTAFAPILFAQLAHSPQHDLCHANSPRHSKGSTCPPRSPHPGFVHF